MESKILSQKRNPFLSREEYLIEISSKTTPTFDDIKKIIGKDESLSVVKKLEGYFGRHIFKAEAVVYDSEDLKEKVEIIPKKVRKKLEEEKKKIEEARKKAEEEAKNKVEEKSDGN